MDVDAESDVDATFDNIADADGAFYIARFSNNLILMIFYITNI